MKLYLLCIVVLFFIGCITDSKSPIQNNQNVEVSSSSEMSSSSNTPVPISFSVSLFNLNNVLLESVTIDSIVTIVLSTDGEERFVDAAVEKSIVSDRYSTSVMPISNARFNIDISVYINNYVVGVATKSSVFVQEYSEPISLTLGLNYGNLEQVNKGIPKTEPDELSSSDEESSEDAPLSYADEESASEVKAEESSIDEMSYAESSEAAVSESSDIHLNKVFTETPDGLIVFDSFDDGDMQTDFAANLAMVWGENYENAGGLWSIDYDSESVVVDANGNYVGPADAQKIMNNGAMHFTMITGPEGGKEDYHVVNVSASLLHREVPVDLGGVESIHITARGTGTISIQFEGLNMPDWGRYEARLDLGDSYKVYRFDIDEFLGSAYSLSYGITLFEQIHEVTKISFSLSGYDTHAEVEIDEIIFVGIDVLDVPWVND